MDDPRKTGLLARWIERRLGGYRHRINEVDDRLPYLVDGGRTVAVVGAGLAGMTAALTLADHGVGVSLYDPNPYVGGKIGSWPVTLGDGATVQVEHGFHAFFRQYYNLSRFLARIGAAASMVPIPDYAVVTAQGKHLGFADIDRTPLLNMLSMARHGIYRLGEVARNPKSREMLEFLRYDPERTFSLFDQVSYQEFADRIELSPDLRFVFNTFSRAFFADHDRMSMAEMIKSFHSYFLSNAQGLVYDYPDDDYELTILKPFREALSGSGGRLFLETPVTTLRRRGDQLVVAADGKETFDAVVLAADVKGVRRIAAASDLGDPALARRLERLRSSQRYAVFRFWTTELVPWNAAPFVITEKERVLDSVSVYHDLERSSARWARETGGGVYELHCYAIPDDMGGEDAVREAFLSELHRQFPAFGEATIRDEHLQLRDDFTAYHTGLRATRPVTRTELPNLFLAGDWVALPVPAMLMEAACTSGLLAANAILADWGAREEPVESVPVRGLLAPRRR